MKNSKKKTKKKVKRIVIKPKNINIILHYDAVDNVDLFLTILERKEERMGNLINYMEDEGNLIEYRQRAYMLACLTDVLIEAMFKHGAKHLNLKMSVKKK